MGGKIADIRLIHTKLFAFIGYQVIADADLEERWPG